MNIEDVQDLIERVTADNEESGLKTLLLDPRTLDSAIIGFAEDGDRKRIVYDEHLLIEALMKDMKCSRTEAYEWYEYNTLRSLPYFETKTDVAPMVVMK